MTKDNAPALLGREYWRYKFAKAAMAGYNANDYINDDNNSHEMKAKWCIKDADALLAELEKTNASDEG